MAEDLYLVTERELQSATVNAAGELEFTRENGQKINAGVVVGPAATNADVASFVSTDGPTKAALNATYAAGAGAVNGDPSRRYGMILGAIRNEGSPNYFQPLNDAGHAASLITSVETLTDRIRIRYKATTRVGAVFAKPDEALMAEGFSCGESVGVEYVDVFVYRSIEYADYVSYNGTQWVSTNGKFTPSFSGGTLTLTHKSLLSNPLSMSVGAVSRGGVYLVNADGAGQTSMTVQFRDYAGTLITTPDVNMKVYARHGGPLRQLMNPQLIDTTMFPFSNFWVMGANGA